MSNSEQEKINKAVRDCVAFCNQSQQIMPKIAEFLSTLSGASGWQEAEIREIEIAVLRVLPWRLPRPNRPR